MNEVRFTLTENARLAPNVYRLRLAGDASAITAPGQFLELSIPGFFPQTAAFRLRLGGRKRHNFIPRGRRWHKGAGRNEAWSDD